MTEPSSAPEPHDPQQDSTVDPLAETYQAPEVSELGRGKRPLEATIQSFGPIPTPDESVKDTCNISAEHGTLQLPASHPAAKAVDAKTPTALPASATFLTPDAILDQTAVSPTLPTQVAPVTPKQDPAPSLDTIAHVSQLPANDPVSNETRVLPASQRDAPERLVSPTAKNQDGTEIGEVPMTLVVDSTKQPPRSRDTHDTPFIQSPSVAGFRPTPGMPQHVGDYEILGVLGRGGMGVVYKARQKRLNRIVALKMILGGLHASDEDLRRFRQEAEASARLQHPNIVQIHEIGDIDGKPYFSLEFADGGSLSGKMANEPQPAFAAAQLIEILARAMHYAHQRGVVHRDLKPANILLATPAPDGSSMAPASTFGIPKVTDFGLAKRMDVDLGQTQTGAILGTPSYMAPEQAGGRIREIGPCTDIYALGAILYDLLTGRPPFKANTLADTLRQVQMTEPVSPGRLQPQVPRDLATICLKCLNKEPKKRYETSLELAEDLGRFLAGEPIRARPASTFERAYKWSKRRPALAALIGVSVACFVAMGVGGWYTAWSLYDANVRIRAANEIAEGERAKAEASLGQALEAIDGVLTQVSVDLAEVPLMEKPRIKLLNKALDLFQHLHREDQKTAKARFQSARAHERRGEVQALFDDLKESERAYQQAESGLKELVADAPTQPEFRAELARTEHNEGLLFRKKGLVNDAERAFAEAIRLRSELAKEYPEDPRYLSDLSQSTYWLGTTLARMRGRYKEAEDKYRSAIEIQKQLLAQKINQPDANELLRDYARDQARMLNNLGILLRQTQRNATAIKTFQEAVQIQDELAAKNKDIPTIRREQARSLSNLAVAQWQAGERTTALETFSRATQLLANLIRDFPSVPAYRDELATVYLAQGVSLRIVEQPDEAEQAFRKSLAIHEELVREFPAVPDYQLKLSDDCLAIAGLHVRDQRSLLFEQMINRALEIQNALVKKYPATLEFARNLHNSWITLGSRVDLRTFPESDHLLGGRSLAVMETLSGATSCGWSGASTPLTPELVLACQLTINGRLMAEYSRATALGQLVETNRSAFEAIKKAHEQEPRRKDYLDQCVETLKLVGNTQLKRNSYADVAKIAKELASLDPTEPTVQLSAAEYLLRAMLILRSKAGLEPAEAEKLQGEYAAEAIKHLQEAFRLDPDSFRALVTDVPWWKSALQRPDFAKVVNELIERGKPAIN
jgi:serine/threonine protein kinase